MHQHAAGQALGLDVIRFLPVLFARGFGFGRKSPPSCDTAPACAGFSAAPILPVGLDFGKCRSHLDR